MVYLCTRHGTSHPKPWWISWGSCWWDWRLETRTWQVTHSSLEAANSTWKCLEVASIYRLCNHQCDFVITNVLLCSDTEGLHALFRDSICVQFIVVQVSQTEWTFYMFCKGWSLSFDVQGLCHMKQFGQGIQTQDAMQQICTEVEGQSSFRIAQESSCLEAEHWLSVGT